MLLPKFKCVVLEKKTYTMNEALKQKYQRGLLKISLFKILIKGML